MKLKNTRDKLVSNMRFWRGNLEKGLLGAKAGEAERLQKLIADLVLIEVMLKRSNIEYVEVDYSFPEASRREKPRLPHPFLWLPEETKQ